MRLLSAIGYRQSAISRRGLWLSIVMVLASSLVLTGCEDTPGEVQPGATPTPRKPGEYPANLPTATVPAKDALTQPGRYENRDLGISATYPSDWQAVPQSDGILLATLRAPSNEVVAAIFSTQMPSGLDTEQAAGEVFKSFSSEFRDVRQVESKAFTLQDGREAWTHEFSAQSTEGTPLHLFLLTTGRGAQLFGMWASVDPDNPRRSRSTVELLFKGLSLKAPQLYGISRDQALFMAGGESNNSRVYDPATSQGNNLIFSGLVMLNPQLEVQPDLAESWDISSDGTVYTFRLRSNARFHNGRPVTAQDIVYSWERAADPDIKSDTVLTYLGDIVGLADKREGKAKTISGLKVINDRTIQVTIDAPKPYFLMKLTYGTSAVLDRANVETGPNWYKTPNGTGPYRLIRWDAGKAQLYERNNDFYLQPPAIPYIVIQMYAGVPIRLYETGEVDLAGVYTSDVGRVRDPKEPLNSDLYEGVSMCTSKISFDVQQSPFDDVKVRQGFAMALDKQQLVDVTMDGIGIPAHGLYPPALPGYNVSLKGLGFDPELARQRLSESRYGSAEKLPPIVFTSSGFGSDVSPSVAAVADMWRKNLGVTIEIENLEPDKYQDELYAGRHGQLFSDGWCADYPDPENFADALYHSGAQANLGNYSNPSLDRLLEQARVERDVARRMAMYGQAEEIIVNDAASIFLSHSLSFTLVKPYVKGYTETPIDVPLYRYLSLDASSR